ncbi:MAG: AMP-binding protein [Planctomycetota bacterium]|nr:AMP-binding protein [Planctomycetota bacterium]
MQVEDFLEHSAREFPRKTALVCGERRCTYQEIDHQCNQLAHALIGRSVRRGDRVAVCLNNSIESAVSVFGILKAGGVFMMVNPTTKTDKLAYVLNNSRASALISSGEKLRSLAGFWAQTPHLKTVISVGLTEPIVAADSKHFASWNHLLASHANCIGPPAKTCIDIDLASLIYTSGSTGDPKGAMLTHLNMVSAATSITTYLENTPDDIILDTLPLSFDYGLYQVLMGFKIGGTVMLEKNFAFPHVVLKRLAQEKVTGFPIVPMMLAILLQMDLSKYDFSSVRYISNTGAALPVDHIVKLRKLLPHVRIYSMYGLTECKRVSYLPPDQIDKRPASVGRGMPNEEVYIVNEQGDRVEPGVVGELVVRGSNLMKGYWERPEETERVLRPGPLPYERVFYTGDLFWMDEEGYLYFVGRKDDIIKSRGEKVSPKEVENVLHSLEGVAEAAVIGVPDPVLGQAIKAVLVRKNGVELTTTDVMRHCRNRLEDFMVPKHVEFRDSMPRTSTGKINKREL